MDDVKNGKKEMLYNLVDRGELKQYRFTLLGEQQISVAGGAFNCVGVKSVRDSGKRITELWFAKDKGYVPVKIIHDDEGDRLEAELSSVN